MIPTGILGGSFNPAHSGHRRISLFAARCLGLKEVWWLVSPGNPLKPVEGMAPLAARLASARALSRNAPIRATAIESRLRTRYTADTLRLLVRRYPKRRFIWLMGADNLVQFHRWQEWRSIARTVPIAVIARPGYDARALRAPAMGWLRRYVRPAAASDRWTTWRPPTVVLLRSMPDPSSATAARAEDPQWHLAFQHPSQRDRVTHRAVPADPPF